MPRRISLPSLVLLWATTAFANVTPKVAQDLYDRVTPSLVAVQYVWQNELGRRELTGAGIVVSEDGLVMAPIAMFNPNIPDEQMKEFKILVPRENDEPQELDAVFQGRDERTSMAFIKTKEPQKWKPIKFEETKVEVGEPILSVGMLPKGANYKTYVTEAAVSALLRGETPQVLVTGGGLAATGSPVFTEGGKAIGIVPNQTGQGFLLDDPREQGQLTATILPPKIFIPARYFEISLQDPPTPQKPIALPWMGVPRWTGITKDVAEVYGLGNQPAVQVGDVIADAPADKAGLKSGDIIVKMDGKPLERGDEPAELPLILGRNLLRHHVGDTVTFSVLREKDQPLVEVPIKLADRPKQANTAKRFFADDLGFSVRDVVFYDTYNMHLPADTKGVMVALLRPQGAAQSGGLHNNDLITRLDNEPVVNVEQFQKTYTDLRKQKPKEAIVLEVHRDNRENTIRIEPPQ